MTPGSATALADPEPAADTAAPEPAADTAASAAARPQSGAAGRIRRTVHFEDGLVGFAQWRRFVLHSTDRAGLYWLESLDQDGLALLLADPFLFVPEYTVELSAADIAALGAEAPTDIMMLAVVTLSAAPTLPSTINLQGPIAVNLGTGRAKQIVLAENEHGLRHPLVLTGAP